MEEQIKQSPYREIWETLSQIDVSPWVEKKLNLSYLSWAHAWRLLMETYPEASYHFLKQEVCPDGTVTVYCAVSIPVRGENCVREMWLPVMDNRNNAIVDPNSRDISDTKMRCLVKTLAMFGLGHSLYAGEDITPQEKPAPHKEAPKKAKEPVAEKKEPVVEVVAAPPEKPKKAEKDRIDSPDGASEVVARLLEFAEEFCADESGLIDFWRKNKNVIDILDTNFPAQYGDLKEGFTALRKKLKGEENA